VTSDRKPHLLHVFSTFALGGQQMRFITLANALKDEFRHTVLAMDGDLAAASRLDPSVTCDFVRMDVVRSGGISLGNLAAARRILRQARPDLLLTYNWGAIEWVLANRLRPLAPHSHFEDGFGPDESPTRQNPRRALMRRLMFWGFARIIVPSRTLERVATERWHVAPGRVIFVPNGIDAARFAGPPDTDLLASLGIAPGVPLIGTVAALRREKNLARLLRVFAALPEDLGAMLAIVGDGAERLGLEAEAARLGIARRVIFTGALAQPERLIGRFDIFALTSDTEQMPISVLEAMAAGRPVVATDVGDVRAILADANHPYVVPMADEAGFTAALADLLSDPARGAALGAANRRHVEAHYALGGMLDRYRGLFGGAIAGRVTTGGFIPA
jgi:glycosyltransferase involved in cell wall biosynthesis